MIATTTPTATCANPVHAAPCLDCGTIGGARGTGTLRPKRTQGRCSACYQRHVRRRDLDFRPCLGGWGRQERPASIPTGIVTIAMLGIDPAEVMVRCAAAARLLAYARANAERAARRWAEGHPERATPEAIEGLYPDPLGLDVSGWYEGARAA